MGKRVRRTLDGLEIRAFGWPPVGVSWGVLVLPLALTFPLWISFTPVGWLTAAIVAPACVLSILAHELGHAYAARRYGLEPFRIELYATGGHCLYYLNERVTVRAQRFITLAGPAANLAIGLACIAAHFALTAAPDAPDHIRRMASPQVSAFYVTALRWIGWINIVLGVTNLFPALPLDGGRLAASFIEPRWGRDVALFWVGVSGVAFGVLSLVATVTLAVFAWMLVRLPPEFTPSFEAVSASSWRPWPRRAPRPERPPPPRRADVPAWLKQPNAPAGSPEAVSEPQRKVVPLKTEWPQPPANRP